MHPRDIGDASSPTSRGSSPLAGVLSKLEMEKTSFRDVLQLSGWLAGDVEESRNGNPTRDLQMATDRTRHHPLCRPVVSSLFSLAARC